MIRHSLAVVLIVLVACPAAAKKKANNGKNLGKAEDLPADAQIRIGVKRRVPKDECPQKSRKGDRLRVHYIGRLYKDGKKFDSSSDRGDPFEFTLGVGEVIKGWDQGLVGMCVGERRKLVVPSGSAYGDAGAGALVPGGATLVFKVELLAIVEEEEEAEEEAAAEGPAAEEKPAAEEEPAPDAAGGAEESEAEVEVMDLDAAQNDDDDEDDADDAGPAGGKKEEL